MAPNVFAPKKGNVTTVTTDNRSRFAGLVPNRLLPHIRAYVPSLRVGERNRAERRRIQQWLLRAQRRQALANV